MLIADKKETPQARRGERWLPAYATLVFIVLAWFSPWLMQGKVLAPFDIVTQMMQPWRGDIQNPQVHNHFVSDAIVQFVPYRLFAEKSFREDGYLGWNPRVFGGFAQYSDTMGLYFNWTMQMHRFLEFWQAWHIGFALEFLIAGCGMLCFLQSRKISPPLALVGAIAYMGNWQFVAWVYYCGGLNCFCWMPWVLWALFRWRTGKSGFFVPIFLALTFLGGTLQHAAFTVIALGCVWLGWAWEDRKNWPGNFRTTCAFVLWGALALGLCAFMFEPTVSAYFENQLVHQRGSIGYESGVMQPILNFLSYPFYAFPFILGSTGTLDLWKLFRSDLFNVGFFGTLPVIGAFLSLFAKRVPLPAKLLIVAGLVLPLTPLVGVLYLRVHLLWILGGCWGAVEFLNALSELERRKFTARLGAVFAIGIFAWMIASIGIAHFEPLLQAKLKAAISGRETTGQFGVFREWLSARADGLTGYVKIWNPIQFTALAGAMLSILGVRFLSSKTSALRYMAALGVAIQVTLFWFMWTTWSQEREPYGKTETASVFQKLVGDGRLAVTPLPPAERLFPVNTLDPVGVAVSDGYDSIHPMHMKSPSENPWDFPGVSHFLGKEGFPYPTSWVPVWEQNGWKLFQNPHPSMVEITAAENSGPLPRAGAFSRPSLNVMRIEVPKDTAMATVFENFHRGWKWRNLSGGDWTPASRAASNGIAINFGTPLAKDSTIELRFVPFVPAWVTWVEILSALGVLLLLKAGGRNGEQARQI